jgi:hypothetical protein
MGILDDAIREHLDLKRRRGADPSEVESAEREALGPVRRNPNPADASKSEVPTGDGDGFAYDHADDDDWSQGSLRQPSTEPSGDLVPTGFDGDDADPAAVIPEPFEPPPAPRGRGWLSRKSKAPRAPVEPEPPAAQPLSDMGGGETMQYDVEGALAAEHESAPDAEDPADGEDVLEETPEFLSDTPDHDRLWFEQRPPRDFDFDG